jgi:hypothetical protein
MHYKAHILQDRRPYIGQTVCQVWSSNSSWFSRYFLCRIFGGTGRVPPGGGVAGTLKNYFVRTVMCYKAHILQSSSPYIGKILCKVWSLNSSWFSRYSLSPILGASYIYIYSYSAGNSARTTKKLISQDCDGLQGSYFAGLKPLYRSNTVQSLKFQLIMVLQLLPLPFFCGNKRFPL